MARSCRRIALYDPSSTGGITHYTYELAEALSDAGCDVTVVTSVDYELLWLPRRFAVWCLFKPSRLRSWLTAVRIRSASGRTRAAVPASPSPLRRVDDPRWIARLRSLRLSAILSWAVVLLTWRGVGVVHVQWILDRRADLLFLRLLRLFRFRIVYTVHDLLPHDEYTPENRVFFQRVYGYADRLIVHSDADRSRMLDWFSVDPGRIVVIPHGCQTVLFDHVDAAIGGARLRLGLPDDRNVVLFFGLIKPYKGLEYLLEAFETVAERCPRALLLIAGKVHDADPEVHRYYTSLLGRYQGRADVRIRSDYIPLDQVADYFHAADVVVLPYLNASQSGVLLSAYAAGKPVVVTATGGLGEVVRDGESGFVVPPRDAAAIARAILAILEDPDTGRRLGREASRLAETVYSWRRAGAMTRRLYESLFPGASELANASG